MRIPIKLAKLQILTALGRLWTQRGELGFRQIRPGNFIYILPLIIVCRLLDQRNDFFPPHTLFMGNEASAIAYAAYAVGTLLTLALWSKRNMGWFRGMTLVALIGFALWAGLPEGNGKSTTMFICQFAIGSAAIYATYAHVFVLNNAERLLSVLLITFNHGIFVILRENDISNIVLSLMLPGLLLALLALSAFRFRSDLFLEAINEPVIAPPKNIYLLLGVSLSFYTLDIFGEELIRRCATGNDALHGAGLIAAVVLTIVIVSGFKRSVWYTLNLSLLFALVGLTLLAIPLSEKTHSIGNLLFGIGDGFGFMTTFYMIGIVKRYRSSVFFRRITAVTTAELLAAIVATVVIARFLPGALAITAVGLTFFFLCSFTLLSPAFQRNIFDTEWIGDFKKPDIAALEIKVNQAAKFECIKLYPREREVAELLLQGLTARQISANLGISEATVRAYCGTLYKKLGINSRTELLVRFGMQNGDGISLVADVQKNTDRE